MNLGLLDNSAAREIARTIPHWYAYPPKQCFRDVDLLPHLTPPLGSSAGALYLHVPFCRYRCKFCSLLAIASSDAEAHGEYVSLLLAEAGLRLGEIPARSIEYVYLGGGTPSSLRSSQGARLIEGLRAHQALHPSVEIAMEFSPDTVTRSEVEVWRGLGVGRASVGVQTFDDASLARMGRQHTAREAVNAVNVLRQTIGSVNVDLISGFGGVNSTAMDAKTAVQAGATSITIHPAVSHSKTSAENKRMAIVLDSDAILYEREEAMFWLSAEVGMELQDALTMAFPPRVKRYEDYGLDSFVIGLGAGARSTYRNIHLANIAYTRRGTMDALRQYSDRVAAGSSAWQSYCSLSEEEFLRRRAVLSFDRCRISDEALRPFGEPGVELMRHMESDGLATRATKEWRLTIRGALSSSVHASRFSSRAVREAIK